MQRRSRAASLFLLWSLVASNALRAQAAPSDATVVQLNRVTTFASLPNGIDVRDGPARMQIVAVREDVLRIRVSRSDKLGEDASWAVLKEARNSRAKVASVNDRYNIGFTTKALRVSINRKTFALLISDQQGNVLQLTDSGRLLYSALSRAVAAAETLLPYAAWLRHFLRKPG